MILLIVFFISLLLEGNDSGSVAPELLADFFRSKNTHHLITFSCSLIDDHTFLKFTSTSNSGIMLRILTGTSDSSETSCDEACFQPLDTDTKLGFALDTDCEINERTLKNIPRTFFLSERYSWVLWSRRKDLGEEGRNLDLALSLMSDVTFAVLNSSSAQLYDVYKVNGREAGDLNITDAGYWTKEERIQWKLTQTRLQRRRSMHGLRISTVMLLTRFPTYEDDQFLNNYYKRELDAVPRRDYQFWLLMEELYNFTPVFIFLRPKDKHDIWDLTESFTGQLWFATGVLLLCFIAVFHWSSCLHDDTQNERSSLLFIVAVMSQRGPPFNVLCLSGRVLTLSALIFGYLLFTYFSSAIIVKLLSPPKKIDYDLEFLVESDLSVGVENVSYYYFYFTRYPFMILREIYKEKMKSKAAFIPMEEGLAKVRSDQYAFGGDMRILFAAAEKMFTDNEKCSLEAIDMIAVNIPRSIAIPKNSPYDEMLSAGYLLFMERGITHRLDRIWSFGKPACLERDFVPVELHDILFAFVALAFGFVVALSSLLVEFSWKKKIPLDVPSWRKARRNGHSHPDPERGNYLLPTRRRDRAF
ncbi:ionotropic receptor 75a isoform X2 [Bemisia tabaci]|uniref:ionotropic receptor 75a isoform X2 n=1 Tax=Bemisia tabaci TaxID=7038 RepID=UPI003B28B56B